MTASFIFYSSVAPSGPTALSGRRQWWSIQMFHAYVLRSEKDGKFYIGQAEDLVKRLEQHNSGQVRSTKHRAPFILLHNKSFATRSEARWQERKWKEASGRKKLKELFS